MVCNEENSHKIIAQKIRLICFFNFLKFSLALHGHVPYLLSEFQPFKEEVFDREHVIEELIQLKNIEILATFKKIVTTQTQPQHNLNLPTRTPAQFRCYIRPIYTY